MMFPQFTIRRLLAVTTLCVLCIAWSDQPYHHFIWLLVVSGTLLATRRPQANRQSHRRSILTGITVSALNGILWGTSIGAIAFPSSLVRADMLYWEDGSADWGVAIITGSWLGSFFAAFGAAIGTSFSWLLPHVASIGTRAKRGWLGRIGLTICWAAILGVHAAVGAQLIQNWRIVASKHWLEDRGARVTGFHDDAPYWLQNLSFAYGLPSVFSRYEIIGSASCTDPILHRVAVHRNLSTLYLSVGQETDLKPITKLRGLEHLYLSNPTFQGHAEFVDLAPLGDLEKLQELRVANIEASDLTPLADLISLESLVIGRTSVTDLSALGHLTNLKELRIAEKEIRDLSPLMNLKKLESLHLIGNQIGDLLPLAKLTSLKEVWLSASTVRDLSPLSHLTNLQVLNIEDNNVKDLAPLKTLTNLESFDIATSHVSDLSPLAKMTNLTRLSLSESAVNDLSPLTRLASLRVLCIANSNVNDLSSLSKLTNLESLDATATQVSDLSPLRALTNLRQLGLRKTAVRDLAPLTGMRELWWLELDETQVSEDEVARLRKALPDCKVSR